MSVLGFLLLPMVLVASSELRVNDYIIRIENNILLSVKRTERSSNELNLSSLGLRRIDQSAFNDDINLKILNLSNNSLAYLPKSVFSNLNNLEHLSLDNNDIKHFKRVFVGLTNLKSLNISNNPLRIIGAGDLYGLSSSIDIFTMGNSIDRIYTALFQNVSPSDFNEEEKVLYSTTPANAKDYHNVPEKEDKDEEEDEALKPGWALNFPENPNFRVKVCIQQGKVKLVDYMKNNEILTAGCSEIKHDNCCSLYIDDLGITEFEGGWYRIKDSPTRSISTITLKGNNIVRLMPELLNDLPESVRTVDLSRNKIERVARGVITNFNIHFLRLSNNFIEEIEDNAFSDMMLYQLHMSGNRLKNSRFIDTLPRSMVKLFMNRNFITELSISSLPQLSHLHIRENNITILRSNSLQNLRFLLEIDLSKNRIRTLEAGCFRGIRNVYWLMLRDNEIAELDGGVFDGLPRLKDLDLGRNKLTKITEGFRDSLSHNLEILRLDYNLLKSLEPGSFVNVPKSRLHLEGNEIAIIAKGSFVVPHLYGEDLNHEEPDLSELYGPLFVGNQLALLLAGDIPLPVKERGIGTVILSKNPIKSLKNGDLYGIQKGTENYIDVSQTSIALIQGGLFDNV